MSALVRVTVRIKAVLVKVRISLLKINVYVHVKNPVNDNCKDVCVCEGVRFNRNETPM